MRSLSQAAGALFPVTLPPRLRLATSRLLGFEQADQTYNALLAMDTEKPLPARLLQFMQVRYRATATDLQHIPRTGPAIVVANHPFGFLEAAVLITAIQQFRPDVRILANQLLSGIPELQDLLIPIDVLDASPRANVAGVRQALRLLAEGGLLIVFPAGAVSHFHWSERASIDPPWNPAVARLITLSAANAPVIVPAYVPGTNSKIFHLAGMLHPSARTALLARELFNKKGTTVELRIGHPITHERLAAMPTDQQRIDYLRWRTYLLANRAAFKPNTLAFRKRTPLAEPIIQPVPSECMLPEIASLRPLESSGALHVYLTHAAPIPNVLREIGRLREVTFRQAGEGTGRSLDLDRFDAQYLHLFVWNTTKHEVVGAYRLQPTDDGLPLYTQTLFHFDAHFLRAMGPSVELGRSFIRAEYQRAFAPLLLLWKGIGKFVAANPECKTLFGPVSISSQYQSTSRNLMIAFLEKSATLQEWAGLVRARNANTFSGSPSLPPATVEELSDMVSDLEPTLPGIPVLLRQYLKLGGKLLGFNLDPEFSNALDGLIVVDLTKTGPKLLERYLGKAEAATFLAFHTAKTEPHHASQ